MPVIILGNMGVGKTAVANIFTTKAATSFK
jgi:hypothetical protein